MLPRTILHNLVTLEGYYNVRLMEKSPYAQIAASLKPDVSMTGSGTAGEVQRFVSPEEPGDMQPPAQSDLSKPYWAVVDSHGMVKCLHYYRRTNRYRDIIVFVAKNTPREHLKYLDDRQYKYIVAGDQQVDYHRAFEILNERFNCKVLRVDTGAKLNGILFREGLIDEISLVISPWLAGNSYKSIFSGLELPKDKKIGLELIKAEPVEYRWVHLHYRLIK